MLLDHLSSSPSGTWNTLQPVFLLVQQTPLLLVGGLGSLFLLLAAGLLFLRQKVQSVDLRLKDRDSRTVALASEIESQALMIRQMKADLEDLRGGLRDQHEPAQPLAPLWAGDMPVNLNRRGQIIRLSRKGKSITEIASDLNVAQGEVELLLKVHDLSQRKAEQVNPRPEKEYGHSKI